MKNVVIYKRVSTDEQAEFGFSLDAQEEKVIKYCTSKGINVLKVFSEDYSAWKGFDRPAYNELKNFLKEHKGKVDGILFTQWSRFSRDITESYIEIKRLKQIGVEPNAIEQLIDFSIPENQYMLAIYLAAPQVENDRLSDRTRVGMNQALKQGRWLWGAPYGYKNNKNTKLIEVDENAALLVREAFYTMEKGLLAAEEIRRTLKKKGMPLSKQAFLSMLQKKFYIGKIVISAFKDEPEMIVNGLHKPIIEPEVFEKVQNILNGKKKSYKGITKCTETPLVGLLYCPMCNKPMTGSGSKGNGGVYHYYHCQRAYGCKNSLSAPLANTSFTEFINSFQPESEEIELYLLLLEEEFKNGGLDRELEKNKLRGEIKRLEESLNVATMKNISGVIDDERYLKVKNDLEAKQTDFQVRLNSLNALPPEFTTYVQNSTALASNLRFYYQTAPSDIQKKLAGSIITGKLYFENKTYRTTKINEAIEAMLSVGKGYKEKCSAKNAEQSSVAPRKRFLSNQFFLDIKLLSDIYLLITSTKNVDSKLIVF